MSAAAPVAPEPVSLLRWPAVAQRTGISRTTAWRLSVEGKFPAPVEVGGATLWRSDLIAAWVESVSGAPAPVTDRAAKARARLAEIRAAKRAKAERRRKVKP